MNRFKKLLSFLLLTNKSFRFFRWLGVHVTPIHYYSPIPDIRQLDENVWIKKSDLVGISMNPEKQREFMEIVCAKYQLEYDFPSRSVGLDHIYHTENAYFGYVSAAAMHSMVRHYRPKKIVEIGCGYSTRVLAHAATLNANEDAPPKLTAVDPYPSDVLQKGFLGLDQLITAEVQDISLDLFTDLQEHDILSIDTSHAVKTGGDVVYLYLEILPRLKPGVIVHIHDIFFPYDYPKFWLERRSFWNEQYLLQAFLNNNKAYNVLWGQKYAEDRFPNIYKNVFNNRIDYKENFDSYSIWLQKPC